MVLEFKEPKAIVNNGRKKWHIPLERLAIPESIQITIFGKKIEPESFDIFGHPIFDCNLASISKVKSFGLKVNNDIEAQVIYEEEEFDVPKDEFDSLVGIKKYLSSISSLNEMLNNRKKYIFLNKKDKLNEFVVFGYILLKSDGGLSYIKSLPVENEEVVELSVNDNVEELKCNVRIPCNDSKFSSIYNRCITIDDIKEGRLRIGNNKAFFHKESNLSSD